jgi:integrative and conjugative element protein (TIGR02256 family)
VSQYFTVGSPHPDLNSDYFVSSRAKFTLASIHLCKEFEVNELRQWEVNSVGRCDVIIVVCVNDQVPSRNVVGIKVRERLALVFPHNDDNQPQVRALRKDFPTVAHLNHVSLDEPSSLCLYVDQWDLVQRTWTPQKYLQRVLWWLAATARGSLHSPDQPVERIYFDAAWDLVLPPDFDAKVSRKDLALVLSLIDRAEDHRTIRAEFEDANEVAKNGIRSVVPIVLTLDSIVHGRIEHYPHNLGILNDQLTSHGASLLEPLRNAIRAIVGGGIRDLEKQFCLLILRMEVRRSVNLPPENVETRAFPICQSLATLGVATGALYEYKQQFYAHDLIGGVDLAEQIKWRDIKLLILDVKKVLTKDFAREASGISQDGATQQRILAGLGALGSSLADIWSREAWGEWTFVDKDYVQPHNIIRHVAKNFHIGTFKVDAVKHIVACNYHKGHSSAVAVPDSILNFSNPKIEDSLKSAALLVDATTTLEVPRDLSQRDDVCRSASVFLTPSGDSSVLLLEDVKREFRLDHLEAQYYFAILNNAWGTGHLTRERGSLVVGSGCRDVSTVLSIESVQLHSAILARQIRLFSKKPEACIRIWTTDKHTGAVNIDDVPVNAIQTHCFGVWKIVSHAGILSKLNKIRQEHLPNETGGVIVGYTDHKIKKIYIIDVLPPPPDSQEEPTGFIRGVEGLTRQIEQVKQQTSSMVGYIGEWHSHPPFSSVSPSRDDRILMEHLTTVLNRDGEPAVMIIIGSEKEISFNVRSVT